MSAAYQEMLRDPRWQRRRLEIMNRAQWKCEKCHDDARTLNVHHARYRSGAAPWEYTDAELICVCEDCHLEGHILEAVKAKEIDEALEEAIQGAYIIGMQTTNPDTRASAFRVMGKLVAQRSPQRVERMEIERGLR